MRTSTGNRKLPKKVNICVDGTNFQKFPDSKTQILHFWNLFFMFPALKIYDLHFDRISNRI